MIWYVITLLTVAVITVFLYFTYHSSFIEKEEMEEFDESVLETVRFIQWASVNEENPRNISLEEIREMQKNMGA